MRSTQRKLVVAKTLMWTPGPKEPIVSAFYRPPGGRRGGELDLPGGEIRTGDSEEVGRHAREDILAGARREVGEETNRNLYAYDLVALGSLTCNQQRVVAAGADTSNKCINPETGREDVRVTHLLFGCELSARALEQTRATAWGAVDAHMPLSQLHATMAADLAAERLSPEASWMVEVLGQTITHRLLQ